MAKKIIVLGGIGANDRKNRDGFRVLDRGGQCVGLQAHIHTEPPLVVKRCKKR